MRKVTPIDLEIGFWVKEVSHIKTYKNDVIDKCQLHMRADEHFDTGWKPILHCCVVPSMWARGAQAGCLCYTKRRVVDVRRCSTLHCRYWRVAALDEQCSIGFQPVPDRKSAPARLFIGNNFGLSRRRRSMRTPAQAGSLF